MFHRIVKPLKTQSFYLFGARGTGKTTFLQQYLPKEKVLWLNLLDANVEDEFIRDPQSLARRVELLKEKLEWVVIDEVQKVPRLLDVVHQCIESTSVKFALTGSSARKLKRGAANLLAGRAFVNHLFPLTHLEMGESFQELDALHYGTLPKISQLSSEEEKQGFLQSYAFTYLKEEIIAEQAVRRLEPFRKFLEVAAQCNGGILNYTNIGRDTGVDVKTVQSYFSILEDTLVGFLLPAYHRSVRKQQRQNPKFYFFDTGVKRALEHTLTQNLLPETYAFGKAFEHFILLEVMRLNTYFKRDYQFSYLRTKDDAEIDLIIDRPSLPTVLLEIKSAKRIDERDTKTVERFLKDFPGAEAYCLSRDVIAKKIGQVRCLPWQEGLKELFF